MKYEKHPKGDTICYDDRSHRYFIQGKPSIRFISGTQIIRKYFPFDTMKISNLYAKKYGLDPVQVRKGWKEYGDKSIERGNRYHSYAERLLKNNCGNINPKDNIMKIIDGKFKDLYKKGFLPICAECIVASPSLQIAGSIDLMMGKDNILLIGDWKFVEELKYENNYRNDSTALDPISNIPNTNYYKYVLQLSLYKYIIKREGYYPEFSNYKIQIFHINDSGLSVIKVPDFTTEIKNIIAHYNKERDN